MSEQRTDPGMLLSAVSQALRSLPGATALHSFGSLASGRGDAYSDVDLTLISDDLVASVAARHAVLSRVAPLALEWRIDTTPDAWAATFLFADTSPFHKLDLGVVGSADGVDGILLWRQEPARLAALGDTPASKAFAPVPGTVEHVVIGHLFGATRYVKARRRGNDLTCWRFASALLDATLALHYARSSGTPFFGRKLTTTEYLKLDATMSPELREQVTGRMRFFPAEAMDHSVRLLLADMLDVVTEISQGPSIPASLVTQFMTFFDAELGPARVTGH